MHIWHIVLLLFLPLISFSGASILLPSSSAGLKKSVNLNYGRNSPELPTDDVSSRLDILENVIFQLRKENKDQQEGMHQLKIQNEIQYKEILQLKNDINHQKEDIKQLKNENSIQKEEIRQLKNENQNRKEETQQIKSTLDSLILDCSTFNRTTNHYLESNTELSIGESKNPKERKNGAGTRMKRQANADGDTSSASWAKLEISDHVIGYMDYDSYTVKIYDHASNKNVNMKNEEKKYYFEPIGQLDHRTAKSAFNNISKKAEMTFNVNMWSDSIRNGVHKFIADDLKLGPVNINLVRVLPMDRVMLFNEIGSSQHFEIDQSWINYKSDKYLKFKYTCEQLKECNDLAMQMKNNPEQFHFNMRFSLSSQKSQTKTTKINVENILNGEMMNELQQKFPNKETILLTANGKKQLLKESSENVIIQTIDDSQVPSKSSQSEIYRRLENMIQFSRSTIQKGDEKAWENNVFWNQDNYRPDLSSKIVNDIYNKLDTENQNKFASSFSNTNKVGYESDGSFLDLGSWGAKVSADFSREGFETKESVDMFLIEAKDRVEWNGVKFVPKQMELYVINMARVKTSQAFKDTDIRISYTTSMLTINVRHDSSFDRKTSSELFELETKLSGLNTSFSSSFGDLRNDMANLKVEFRKEIKELEHLKRKGISSQNPPSSCQELSKMGHYLNGLYAIKDKGTRKVQAVYCRFESTVSQDSVGYIDVKTKSVHFYVQRNSSFSTPKAVIPFELARLNEGGAFNLVSGIFTVPVKGIYHFQFSGQHDRSALAIFLQLNGAIVGDSYTFPGNSDIVSLSASFRLEVNDQVNLYLNYGILHDGHNHYSHFSGWLEEEDLM